MLAAGLYNILPLTLAKAIGRRCLNHHSQLGRGLHALFRRRPGMAADPVESQPLQDLETVHIVSQGCRNRTGLRKIRMIRQSTQQHRLPVQIDPLPVGAKRSATIGLRQAVRRSVPIIQHQMQRIELGCGSMGKR